jgi:hypothetical protein
VGDAEDPKLVQLREDAKAGEPRAQRLYALRLLRGQGVTVDESAGAEWMHRAAQAGLRTAQRTYAELLEAGQGVDADPGAARDWYRAAAEAGDPVARDHLRRLGEDD